MTNVRKAVIPVAGFGTRFLPVTKVIPKALLPVLDTPVIHLAVREAAAAGIEHVVMVVSPDQEAIGAYFDESTDLERMLERQGRFGLLERMPDFSNELEITYVQQREPLGNGHAVLVAKHAVGDEPLAVLLPDDVIRGSDSTIGRMIEIYGETGGPVIGVAETPEETISQKGVVAPTSQNGRVYEDIGPRRETFHRRGSFEPRGRRAVRASPCDLPRPGEYETRGGGRNLAGRRNRKVTQHARGERHTVSLESCSTPASRQGC